MQLGGPTSRLQPSGLLGIIWTGVAFAILFTILRTAIRIHVFHRLFADDVCIYIALVILISLGVLHNHAISAIFKIERVLYGEVVYPLDFKEQVELFLKLQFSIITLFWTSLWAVKLSFLMFYRKILAGLPGHMIWWRLILVFTVLAYLGCQATNLKSCTPISNYFHIGACESRQNTYFQNLNLYYSTAVDVVCDVLIMALPLRLLWKLQIKKKQKLALAAVFSLAIVIIVVAIVRIVEINPMFKYVDPVWLALWSMTEASVAVVVACLPSFHVLLTSRSSSAFNRRNPSNSRLRQQDNTTRLSEVALSGSSLQNISHDIARSPIGTEN